jgi:tetratricopeptide (TPR) repeat protein
MEAGPRLVLDFDHLPLTEIQPALASGSVTLLLHETLAGDGLFPFPESPHMTLTLISSEETEASSLRIRVQIDRPLLSAEHFAVRQNSHLVLDIECEQPPGNPLGDSTLNIPPDHLLDEVLAPPGSGESVSNARDAGYQSLLGDIARSGGSLTRDVSWSVQAGLRAMNPRATGPDALRDNYERMPSGLEVLPSPIVVEYRENLLHQTPQNNVGLMQRWIRENQESPQAERLLFLLGEYRLRMAKQIPDERLRGGHTLEAIDDFRHALRRFPDSEWAPFAWMRIHQAHLSMGWKREALNALESFQRAGTAYSVGTILMLRANMLRQLKRPDEELSVLVQHLEADPNGPDIADVHFRLGQIFRGQNQRLAAYTHFKKSWERDEASFLDRSPTELAEVIETAHGSADFAWTESLIDYVQLRHPAFKENAHFTVMLGRIELVRGNLNKALLHSQEALTEHEDSPGTLAAYVILADQGRADRRSEPPVERPGVVHRAYQSPQWAYLHIIDNWPDEPIAQLACLRLGETLREDDRALDAARRLGSGLERWPDTDLRGPMEHELGPALQTAIDEALADDDEVMALRLHTAYNDKTGDSPLRPETQWEVAEICASFGLWGKVGELTGDLLMQIEAQDRPALPWEDVLLRHVEAMRNSNRLDEALATVRESLTKYPSGARLVDLKFHRAGILHGLGRYHGARIAAEEALGLGGTPQQRLTALFLRADATKRSEGPRAAAPLYLEGLRAFQESGRTELSASVPFEIVFQLADCLHATGNWNQAARVYEELLRVYPDASERPIFLHRLAQCQAHMGEFDEALANVRDLDGEDNSALWQRLAEQSRSDIEWLDLYPDIFRLPETGGRLR